MEVVALREFTQEGRHAELPQLAMLREEYGAEHLGTGKPRCRKDLAPGRKKAQGTPCATGRAVWHAVSQGPPCGAVWRRVAPCGAVWRRAVPCGAVWRRVEPCGAVRCRVAPCGAVCHIGDAVCYRVAPCGAAWRHVAPSGAL